jgi:mannose-6-phosphate isomerase
MGTHPKAPAQIIDSHVPQQLLREWISSNPWALGDIVGQHFNNELPFLFKVLSVNKALSIQAHPTKEHAERLHTQDPDHYPDSNHKPEMALALTPFEGMCGFRPLKETTSFIKSIPELKTVIGNELADKLVMEVNLGNEKDAVAAVQKCFTHLMNCSADDIQTQLRKLVGRLEAPEDNTEVYEQSLGSLLLRLYSQFPGDVGCFCIYFFNHITLQPGQAMFLGPNIPHAYLSGDCIECMACSDNVVRAGLTPKFKDKDVLCSMLDYTPTPSEDRIFLPTSDGRADIFDPPVPDFSVAKYDLSDFGGDEYKLPGVDGPSICIFIRGDALLIQNGDDDSLDVHRGNVVFIAAGIEVKLTKMANSPLLFRAFSLGL